MEGVRNRIAPPEELKALIESTYEERYAICAVCPESSMVKYPGREFIRGEHCTKCGCKLSLKLRCLSCNCPLTPPRWTQKITREDDQTVKEILNGNT
jgi:hypothetical protein